MRLDISPPGHEYRRHVAMKMSFNKQTNKY